MADFRKIPCYSPPAVRARSGSYSHLSPRFAPGSGGVEPCVRISLRFQWQGGAPGAGRASLDSRVRILSGQPGSPVSGVLFPRGGESPTFPRVTRADPSLWSVIFRISVRAGRVLGAGLWSPFFNFPFGGAETGSIADRDRFAGESGGRRHECTASLDSLADIRCVS